MVLTQQQLADVAAGKPLRFLEPPLDAEFVVIRADVLDRVQRLIDDSDLTSEEMSSLMWSGMRDDWEDPAMDVYDEMAKS